MKKIFFLFISFFLFTSGITQVPEICLTEETFSVSSWKIGPFNWACGGKFWLVDSIKVHIVKLDNMDVNIVVQKSSTHSTDNDGAIFRPDSSVSVIMGLFVSETCGIIFHYKRIKNNYSLADLIENNERYSCHNLRDEVFENLRQVLKRKGCKTRLLK